MTRQQIKKIFTDAVAKKKTPLIGIEAEKFGIDARSGKSAKYTGKEGYLAILGKLYEELGWEIAKQKGKFIHQMTRGKANLNLESDGRIELAGGPHESIHDLAREFRIHQSEIAEISKVFGIDWLGIGYHPISKNCDIENLAEERKDLLIEFFKQQKDQANNDFGLAWFKKTSGIHVNIDYLSEDDFALKSKVFFRLAPLFVGIFANSPFSKKEFTGYMSYRYHVSLHTGIPRFKISKQLYESNFRFDDWLDHVFSLPLLFVHKDDQWIKPQMTFEEYLQSGEATLEDFDMHMKSVWMDLKLKQVIELRCFDSLPPHLVPAVAALVKGLSASKEALESCWEIVQHWTFDEYQKFQEDISRYGLQADLKGIKALDMAKQLINIAENSLDQERILDAFNHSESQFLKPIKEFIFVKEKSPAEWLVQQWQGEWRQNFFPVFEWCQY